MPRKQTNSQSKRYEGNQYQGKRYQRQLEAIQLNAERMKLVRLLHCSSGNHYTSDATRRLIKASGTLIDKVRGNLEKM